MPVNKLILTVCVFSYYNRDVEDIKNLVSDADRGVISIKKRPSISSRIMSMFLWGGGELLGVVIVLLVFNYYNILSLSKIFPNQLGFLPHVAFVKNVQNIVKQSTNEVIAVPTITDVRKFPIDPYQKIVNSAIIYYSLNNIIVHKVTNNINEFTITIPDMALKGMILTVDKDTVIRKDAIRTGAQIVGPEALIDGVKTSISLRYTIKSDQWHVDSIFIYLDTIATPSPTSIKQQAQ